MNLTNKRILLTGATGGVGSLLAKALVEKGASVALVGRNEIKLKQLKTYIEGIGSKVAIIPADLSQSNAAQTVIHAAQSALGDIDILINNAGILDFVAFETQSAERINDVIQTNVTSLIQLSRAIIPSFLQNNQGHFVFVGSIFGSLGFPHYATYCASKFAVHGFSQALRRELVDTNIGVSYIAPRAIETPMNNQNTVDMLKAAGQKMDTPEFVVQTIVEALEKEKQEVFIGQPQSFFAWLNGFAPRLVNLGLKKQTRLAQPYLKK